jgi:hypothetical protein
MTDTTQNAGATRSEVADSALGYFQELHYATLFILTLLLVVAVLLGWSWLPKFSSVPETTDKALMEFRNVSNATLVMSALPGGKTELNIVIESLISDTQGWSVQTLDPANKPNIVNLHLIGQRSCSLIRRQKLTFDSANRLLRA